MSNPQWPNQQPGPGQGGPGQPPQQYPQYPPQYPQYPQQPTGQYQQPGQYPPPAGQYPPPGYQQPGQPMPQGFYQQPIVQQKSGGIPWWAWLIIAVFGIGVVGAIASAGKSNTPTAPVFNATQAAVIINPTVTPIPAGAGGAVKIGNSPVDSTSPTNQPEATTVPIAPTAAPAAPAQQPVQAQPQQAKPTTGYSFVKNFELVKVQGPGQELVGQNAQDDNFLVQVQSVDRVSEIKGDGKSFKSQGVFLILQLGLKNVSNKEHATLIFTKLVDSQGREFSTTTNFDAVTLVSFSQTYKTDMMINPGFSGYSYEVFEVPADASGFKLKLGL